MDNSELVASRSAMRPMRGISVTTGFCISLLVLVTLLVAYPVVLILYSSFQVTRPGEAAMLSLDAWRLAFSDATVVAALWNTLSVTFVRQIVSFPLAIAIAWLLARTDIPGHRWLEMLFWVGFFLPTLPVTLGWILMLDPTYGVFNQLLRALVGGQVQPFSIYSFWGIVWTHLMTGTIAVKVMLLTPAFRNIDSSLEEAATVLGLSPLATLAKISLPLLTPALTATILLSIVHSLQAYEIERILGAPSNFYVFSTKVYSLVAQEPPNYAAATALSSSILIAMVPLIVFQRRLASRRNFAMVGGRYQNVRQRLGSWRIPALIFVVGVACLITVVPLFLLLVGTFMRLFGFLNLAQPWTTDHWRLVFADPVFGLSVRNSLILGVGVGLWNVVLCASTAYVVVRSRFHGRGVLDFMSWVPSAVPGIILSLGLLWAVLSLQFLRPLYGTLVVMIVATAVASMTLGVQVVKGSLFQFKPELEEAASVSGGSRIDVLLKIVVPLLMPVLLLVFATSFIAAVRNVSTVVFLASSDTRPLSLLQLDFMVEGRYEAAAVVGAVVVVLTTGIALFARVLGLRATIDN